MVNYWLHRITGGDNALPFAYPLLFNHNLLSIGWSDFSEDDFVISVKEKGIEAIESRMIEDGWSLERNRWYLYRFMYCMKKGDIVVVPTQGEFSIFEIVDDDILTNESIDKSIYLDWEGRCATYDGNYMMNSANQAVDLGFYIRVRPISTHIPRADYADSDLHKRMKIRQTNADINDLKESINDALASFSIKKPINLKDEIMDETAPKLLEKIHKFTNPDKFEDLVEWYLYQIGANDIIKPSKNESSTEDGDADRVALFEDIKTAIMVQVKKHDAGSNTDDWAVEQIEAYRNNHNFDEYFTQMWVVSTCDKFNDVAKKRAESAGVRLINGLEFCRMILNAGLEGLKL